MAENEAKAELKAAQAKVKALRPWFRKKRYWALGLIVISIISSVASQNSSTTSSVTTNTSSTQSAQTSEPINSNETTSQKNAARTAKNYLAMSGFSLSGLIKQLEFEGYNTADAAYGANAQNADWNLQAARSAKNYLDMSGFSRSGLITQLEFEGYTEQQAAYGATANGL